jgi:EpsI family protein
MSGLTTRVVLIVSLLVTAAGVERVVSGQEATVHRARLQALPLGVDGWQGRATPLATDVVALLGVDDYVYRTYVRDGVPLNLYAGYYDSQRRGDTMHSPRNCLPGAGWQPVESGVTDIPAATGAVRVNRYVIQKGAQRQVALYWYHGRGRVIANEYANKAYLMWDAATSRRTNGGMVRIITPVTTTAEAATHQAVSFAASLLPRLHEVMP